jgi:hypothetical protein
MNHGTLWETSFWRLFVWLSTILSPSLCIFYKWYDFVIHYMMQLGNDLTGYNEALSHNESFKKAPEDIHDRQVYVD